jgi:hypothetical protein
MYRLTGKPAALPGIHASPLGAVARPAQGLKVVVRVRAAARPRVDVIERQVIRAPAPDAAVLVAFKDAEAQLVGYRLALVVAGNGPAFLARMVVVRHPVTPADPFPEGYANGDGGA